MVGTLRADNAAAATPESTDKRGISSSTHTPPTATSQTPANPPRLLLKPTQWRCGRLAVHLAQDLISCLTLMGNLLWASCILLHQRVAVAAGWRRASVRWRHFAFSSSGAWALARAAPPPPSPSRCCVVAAVSPIAPAATQLGEVETCKNAVRHFFHQPDNPV